MPGSRDFYFHAEHVQSLVRAVDMLAVQIRAIDGKGILTPLGVCRTWAKSMHYSRVDCRSTAPKTFYEAYARLNRLNFVQCSKVRQAAHMVATVVKGWLVSHGSSDRSGDATRTMQRR